MADVSATAARRVRSRHCHGGDGAVVDTISGLPDVILQHIFTYIPTKYAIRTSLLSKRWRRVWCDTPSLSFNSSILNDDWINQTPTGYTAPKMMHFHLKSDKKHDAPHIDKWLEFVMSRHVENMVLSFLLLKYSFPDFFYVNPSLKQLTLKYCDMSPECSVSWTSLKKLSLVRCSVSDESMAKILSGCPVLESLTLNRCHGLSYLDLSRSLRLRTVVVVERSSSVTGPKVIEAPHIHYLYLRYAQFPCTLVDVSSLTEADVDTNEVITYSDKVMNMLEKLQHVEKLTFGGNLLQVLSVAQLRGVPFPMFEVKALTLKTRIFHYVIPGIKGVLQNSHDLKKLTVHTIHCKTKPAKQLVSSIWLSCPGDQKMRSVGILRQSA
ncbi:putative F-box/LRR-repeat protein At3g18150 isoform X1 [Raphanus sativus]|uniref:F-box/LRR-repeat protein At3g18150 isoform X1 n=1 Tax=Raphanus sativus TaxID=3726 RepID=A0A9W3D725_RAPSA|nr:putative F-box/LRR-repeat protein At3g18150 isoform X1 [Raphanus sativus]